MDSGHVRVYQNNNGNWVQVGSDIDGQKAPGDQLGYSVSLSSDIAIGAYKNNGEERHVRVYQNNTIGFKSKAVILTENHLDISLRQK